VEARPRRLIVASAAEIVGREVRTLLDDDVPVEGFVGDFDVARDALDEFVRDVDTNQS